MRTQQDETDRCSGIFPALLLAYIVRAVGKDGARSWLRANGEDPKVLGDPNTWIDNRRFGELVASAAALLGDEPSIGRGIAIEILRWNEMMGEHERFRSLGAPIEVLRRYVHQGSRMNTAYRIELESEDEQSAVIAVRYHEGAVPLRVFCDVHLELYPRLAEIGGAIGAAAHTSCAVRGDDACRFAVRWDATTEVYGDNDASGMVERLQTTARELATADDFETMMSRALDGFQELHVPGVRAAVLIVDDGEKELVRHQGFDNELDVARAIERVRNSDDGRPDELLLFAVPLDSGRGVYGTLAVFFPAGSYVTVQDERFCKAYAGHLAAAIEAKRALRRAQRDRDTATTLLDLARALAAAATRRDAVELIEAAVPVATGCADVAVWLVSQETGRLVRHDLSIDLATLPVGVRDQVKVVAGPTTAVLHRQFSATVGVAAVAPLKAGDEFLGLLSAGWKAADQRPSPTMLLRLQGMADQGALGLQVAGLLERIHHQALHDELTGLPNRTLLGDRAEQALAMARRTGGSIGLLFVDLDRFKAVNDTMGHAAGDAVLQVVATRLRTALRGTDTVARVGGDEFVVLLPAVDQADDAVAIAERLRAELRLPIVIGGRVVDVSCTIGVTIGEGGGDEWDDLLRAADTAMYDGKQHGRDAVCVA